jgi:hypothetical protein
LALEGKDPWDSAMGLAAGNRGGLGRTKHQKIKKSIEILFDVLKGKDNLLKFIMNTAAAQLIRKQFLVRIQSCSIMNPY